MGLGIHISNIVLCDAVTSTRRKRPIFLIFCSFCNFFLLGQKTMQVTKWKDLNYNPMTITINSFFSYAICICIQTYIKIHSFSFRYYSDCMGNIFISRKIFKYFCVCVVNLRYIKTCTRDRHLVPWLPLPLPHRMPASLYQISWVWVQAPVSFPASCSCPPWKGAGDNGSCTWVPAIVHPGRQQVMTPATPWTEFSVPNFNLSHLQLLGAFGLWTTRLKVLLSNK